MKYLFLLLMLLIFVSLFRGFYFLMKEGGQKSNKVVQSLAIRVGLTIIFFVGLYVADYYGVMKGHGLREGLELQAHSQSE